MSRTILLGVTLVMLLVAGWLVPRSCGHGSEREPARAAAAQLIRQAILRDQQGQPRHWRAYMLQH